MAGSKAPLKTATVAAHADLRWPLLTMAMSIVHRITGAALYVGTLLLAWWLIAAAAGPNAYATLSVHGT